MNMTRGKLRKLLLKMKQTMKKYKKEVVPSVDATKSTTPKNKNRKISNLHKKTLKRYQMKGGGNFTIECKLYLKSQPKTLINTKQIGFDYKITVGGMKKQISDELTNNSKNIKQADINKISVKSASNFTEYFRTQPLKTILQNSSSPHIMNFYFPDSYKNYLSTHHTPAQEPEPTHSETEQHIQPETPPPTPSVMTPEIQEPSSPPTPPPPTPLVMSPEIQEPTPPPTPPTPPLVTPTEIQEPQPLERQVLNNPEPSSTSTVTVQSLIPAETPAPNYELNPNVLVNNESIDQQLAPFQPHKDAPKETTEPETEGNNTMREMSIDEIISNFAKKVAAEVADRLKSNTDLQDSQEAIHELMPQAVPMN